MDDDLKRVHGGGLRYRAQSIAANIDLAEQALDAGDLEQAGELLRTAAFTCQSIAPTLRAAAADARRRSRRAA